MTINTYPLVQARWPHMPVAAIGAGLVGVTAAGPTLHLAYGGWALMLVFGISAAGAILASRMECADQRGALIVILVGAVAMRLALVFVEPYLSTDIYRYVWDGRVQAAGINPFRYVPSAPEIAHLRDAAIYPNINRAGYAVTIYPPTAQAFFLAITRVGESLLVMKLGLIACEAAIVAALLAILDRQGILATRVAAYAWHPLPIWEIAGNGHVDAAMCALLIVGLLLFLHGRTLLATVAVTLGALVKPTALLALPVFWRPWNWRLPLVVSLTAIVAYLPYLSVGSGVFGYLWGYVDEEGLASGRGIHVLWLLERFTGPMPGAGVTYAVLAAAVLTALAIAVAFRQDRSDQAAIAALGWLLVSLLILASPHYPWYFLVLVPFLALAHSATGWVLTVGCPLLYDSIPDAGWPTYDTRIVVFMLATAAALSHDAWRLRRKTRRLAPQSESGSTPAVLSDGSSLYVSWSDVIGQQPFLWNGKETVISKGAAFPSSAVHANEGSILMDSSHNTHCTSSDPWDCNNRDKMSWKKEGSYYYMMYQGSKSWNCENYDGDAGNNYWGISIARSSSALGSYNDYMPGAPLILATSEGCNGIQYPTLNKIDGAWYMYYSIGTVEKRSQLVWNNPTAGSSDRLDNLATALVALQGALQSLHSLLGI